MQPLPIAFCCHKWGKERQSHLEKILIIQMQRQVLDTLCFTKTEFIVRFETSASLQKSISGQTPLSKITEGIKNLKVTNLYLNELVLLHPGKNLLTEAAIQFQTDKSLRHIFHVYTFPVYICIYVTSQS